MFDTADIDNDAQIDDEVKEKFAELDADGDGQVTQAEFVAAKLAEFAADDDDLFEICCGGNRINMVEVRKKKAKPAANYLKSAHPHDGMDLTLNTAVPVGPDRFRPPALPAMMFPNPPSYGYLSRYSDGRAQVEAMEE